MDEGTSLHRIHLFDGLGHLARCQPMNRLQQETIRACRVVLERSGRVAPRIETVSDKSRLGGGTRIDETICRGPPAKPTSRAEPQCTTEMRVCGQEVSGHSDTLGLAPLEDRTQQREIVFRLVDRLLRQPRRRPAYPRMNYLLGSCRQLIEPGRRPSEARTVSRA